MSKRSEVLRQQNREKMQNAIAQQYNRFHSLGMIRGAYAMCKVILDKATDESKSVDQRINDIIDFCKKAKNPDEDQLSEKQEVDQ